MKILKLNIRKEVNKDNMMTKTIMRAMLEMHQEFGVVIRKDSKGNRGTYASLTAVLEQIHAMTSKYGLLLHQAPWFIDGNMILISRLHHLESEKYLECHSVLTPAGNNPSPDQAYGASTTYHKRYDALSLCGLVAEDDPSDHDGWKDLSTPAASSGFRHSSTAQEVEQAITLPSQNGSISEKQAKFFAIKLKQEGRTDDIAEILNKYGSFEAIPRSEVVQFKAKYGIQ